MRSSAPRPQRRASRSATRAEGGTMRRTADRTSARARRWRLRQSAQPQREPHPPSRSAARSRTSFTKLSALDLAIALKRAIYDAGYTCKRVTDGGFVGEWKNLDMWMAHCVYDTATAARLGDLHRARRERTGAGLQGHSGQRPARMQNSEETGWFVYRGQARDREKGRIIGLVRVALASFLILAGRRHFLDRHAIALADFLAPAAVRIGDAIALLGTRLPSLIS